ncbi:hypothetical protein RB195_003737 [Necator americanus]|uniref:Uncharacterized protein n=1 Tax=Necator americanus TaxID=51031 RepID=A0ABR1DPX1_NECAM
MGYQAVFYVLPLCPLFLALFTTYYFRTVRKKRKTRIDNMVTANGVNGWKNYASVLENQWNRQHEDRTNSVS